MSVEWVKWAFDQAQLPASVVPALPLLVALCEYADGDGKCWPSMESLAQRCRCSLRQARRIVSLLRGAGLVTVAEGRGRGNVSVYALNRTPMTGIVEIVETENRTPMVIKPDMGGIKPDTHGIKPVMDVRENHKEPSGTTKEPLILRRKAPHTAPVVAYIEATGITPNVQLCADIDAVVDDVERWREVVVEWLRKAYNPKSVASMLQVYRDGWRTPAQRVNGNGRKPVPEPEESGQAWMLRNGYRSGVVLQRSDADMEITF